MKTSKIHQKIALLIQCLMIAIILIMTQACGFHLRNQTQIPSSLHIIYLKSDDPYGSFTKQLTQTLRAYGIQLVSSTHHAPITLEILSDNFSKQATSISATSQLTQYLLTETMSYQLHNSRGNIISGPTTITTVRNYSATFNQMLGASNEEEQLSQEMRRDTVYQLINRLSTFNAATQSL